MLKIFTKKLATQKQGLAANRLSNEAASQVAGGRMLNPQPLPPRYGTR